MSRIQRAGDEKVLVWEPYQYRSTTKTRPSLGFEGGRGGREVYRRLGPEQCSLSVREGTPLLLLKERERGGAGVRGRRVERLGSSNRRRAEFVCLHAEFAGGSSRLAQ